MDKKILAILVVASIIVVLPPILFYFLYIAPGYSAKNYDSFAQCLTEKGAAMYGAYWCNHCAAQKEMFGKSFKYINYIECDSRGENAKPELCEQAAITGYPTWIIDRKQYKGVQQFETLASITNCSI